VSGNKKGESSLISLEQALERPSFFGMASNMSSSEGGMLNSPRNQFRSELFHYLSDPLTMSVMKGSFQEKAFHIYQFLKESKRLEASTWLFEK